MRLELPKWSRRAASALVKSSLLRTLLAVLWLAALPASAQATSETDVSSAQTIWRLLDYLAVDYSGAVDDGRVVSKSEFAEMNEFAESVATRLDDLSAGPATQQLHAQAEALKAAIAAKAPAGDVATRAHALAADLLAAYPVPLAPTKAPDLARGAALYAENCAACHGAAGHGDGPAALGLNPPPVDFTDRTRARKRSVFGLYQVIGQGLEGTAMASFDQFPAEDRWALAFYAGGLAYTDEESESGKRLWADDQSLHSDIPDLKALVQIAPLALAAKIGDKKALDLTAYLRKNPGAVFETASPLALAKKRLAESLAAYEAGDRRKATDIALSAYLDGFEPVEAALSARGASLVHQVETAMIDLRAAISRGAPAADVEAKVNNVSALLDEAERALASSETASGASFVGAYTILVREGLEALLIVVAMIAFLRKAERPEAIKYVHGGWIGALAGGVMTWFAATYLISISGAGRELTEGIGSLTAAIVLITVGIWMHGKSHADAWRKYINEKMSRALTRQSAWFLFLLAFVVVYREVFETILFYIALWSESGAAPILLGAGLGAATLAAIAWALLSYSRRLPIGQFFRYSSFLIAVLAVILAGKGVAALQEAGWLAVRPISQLPRIELIGLYPTVQGVLAQFATLAVLIAAFWWNDRRTATVRAPQ